MKAQSDSKKEVIAIHYDRYYNKGTCSGKAEDTSLTLSGVARKGTVGRIRVYQAKETLHIKAFPYIYFCTLKEIYT